VFNSSNWCDNLQSEKHTNAIKSLPLLVQINVKKAHTQQRAAQALIKVTM